jgi:hypothetical protein
MIAKTFAFIYVQLTASAAIAATPKQKAQTARRVSRTWRQIFCTQKQKLRGLKQKFWTLRQKFLGAQFLFLDRRQVFLTVKLLSRSLREPVQTEKRAEHPFCSARFPTLFSIFRA